MPRLGAAAWCKGGDVYTIDLTVHPSSAQQVTAFERGLKTARQRAIARGMGLSGKLHGTALTGAQLMAKPWLGEGKGMRPTSGKARAPPTARVRT